MITEVMEYDSKILTIIEIAKTFNVFDQEDASLAGDHLNNIKKLENQIEAKRLELTKPINVSLKIINDNFKEIMLPLKEAGEVFKNKILTWRRIEQEKINKEKKALAELAIIAMETEDQEMFNLVQEIEKPVEIKTTIGNTQARKIWKYEIMEFSKVPDGYKAINSVRVNAAIKDGIKDIPGLRIYQEEIIAINSR